MRWWIERWYEKFERLMVRMYLRRNNLHLARYIGDHWNEDPFPEVFGEVIWTDGTWIP